MTIPAYDFSGRDFTTEYERLLTLLVAECPELTDLNHADPGVSLIRLAARETDQLNFYLDQAFREGFLQIAQFKQSLIELARTVDYLPVLASPASATIRLTRIAGVEGEISIPALSGFARSDGMQYVTVTDSVVQTGANYADVAAWQGAVTERDVLASEWVVGDLTGRPRINLGENVAAGLTTLWLPGDPSVYWEERDSFWRSTATDRHFMCLLQADPIVADGPTDTVWLVLGDGTWGMAAPTQTVRVRYVTTAGPGGNCGSGVITSVPDELTEYVTATNIESATGGAYAETIASLRRSVPAVTHAQRRGVTKRDYGALVEHIPGVLRCSAYDREDALNWPHLYVHIVVVPDGGGVMSAPLRAAIEAELCEWGHFGNWAGRYILSDATALPVDVTARIGVATGYGVNATTAAAVAAINALLAQEMNEIGGVLRFADLHIAVSRVAGVSWVEFAAPTQDVAAPTKAVITAGTVTVTAA